MRARLMHAAPSGAMVAVASSPDDIAAHMTAGRRPRRDQRIRQLRGRRPRAGDQGVHQSPCRCGHRRPAGPNLARLPFQVDGPGARTLRRVPVHRDAASAANSDAVQRNRHLDDRRGGHRPEPLGTTHPVHRAVRRRTSDPARRHPPGARRGGTRRQSDRIGCAHARVVGHPPCGSPDAPPRAEPRTIGTPSCWRSASCGRPEWTWTGHRCIGENPRRVDSARLCLCAPTALDRAGHQRRAQARRLDLRRCRRGRDRQRPGRRSGGRPRIRCKRR